MSQPEPQPAVPMIPGPPRFQFLRVIFALVAREMSTRYSRGTGGYLWAVASPVLSILVMSVVFSLMFRTPSLGNSFILFYTTGFVPFQMYQQVQSAVMGAVKYNRALMQYPAVTPMDAILARGMLVFLTQIMIGLIILIGAMQIADTPVNLDFAVMTHAMICAAALGVGVGAVNCVVIAFLPTWERFWSILTTPLMIISCVLYIFEEAPRFFQQLLWFNPLVHLTGTMRSGVFGAYEPAYVELIFPWSLAAVTTLTGFYLLRRHQSRIVNPRF